MVHLAIECCGSESEFEDTIKVINEIWYSKLRIYGFSYFTLYLLFRKSLCKQNLGTDENDPFLVQCKCPDNLANLKNWTTIEVISALELAFRYGKPERAIVILEITGGNYYHSFS